MKKQGYLLLYMILAAVIFDLYIFSMQLQGTGFLSAAKCIEGWQCRDYNLYGYQAKNCLWRNLVYCDYDCGPEGCIAQPTAVAGITRLTTSNATQALPRISGNYVVYFDNRNSFAGGHDTDVYIYNVASNSEDKIISAGGPVCENDGSGTPKPCTANDGYKNQANPDISNGIIVFEDYSRVCNLLGEGDVCPTIYKYDVNEKKATFLIKTNAVQFSPRIDGNNVVWYELDTETGAISAVWYDISLRIKRNLGPGQFPAVSNNKVVFMPLSYGNLQLFDIAAQNFQELPVAGSFPVISGNDIVYSRFDNVDNGTNIYLYDLNTKSEKKINSVTTKIAGGQSIYGNEIAYHALRDSYVKIVLYNIATETETIIDNSPYNQTNPSIFGNKIAYEKEVDGNKDIYIYTISE